MSFLSETSQIILPYYELEAIFDALEEVLSSACGIMNDSHKIEYDSMAISSYADALRILHKYGRVRITEEAGRQVTAVSN